MIAIKRPRLWCGILIGVVLTLAILFYFCYKAVNDPKTAFRVKEVEVNYGAQDIEADGVLLTVENPILEKYFDEDFQSDVLLYKIPFEAHNTSDKHTVDFDETNLQIVSAGQIQLGWPYESYENGEKTDTNWGDLQPGETTRGYWLIEAVIDGFPEAVYRDYDLYFLQHEGDTLFKYRFAEH